MLRLCITVSIMKFMAVNKKNIAAHVITSGFFYPAVESPGCNKLLRDIVICPIFFSPYYNIINPVPLQPHFKT